MGSEGRLLLSLWSSREFVQGSIFGMRLTGLGQKLRPQSSNPAPLATAPVGRTLPTLLLRGFLLRLGRRLLLC
jgi:hypothetical protein